MFSQNISDKKSRQMINAADELFYYYADYKQASKTYETLIKSYPNNANLQMKLGVCYLNIDG